MRMTIIQLSTFVTKWRKLGLTDENLQELEAILIASPHAGDVIPGTGGLRKVRFAPPGWHTGKRGAARVIYAFIAAGEAAYLFTIYGKNERSDLTPDEKKCSERCFDDFRIFTAVERKSLMPARPKRKSARPRIADEIMAGMRELERMLDQGKTPQQMFTVKTIEVPDPGVYRAKQVRSLRDSLGVSQTVFAHLLGVSVILVKSWERGVRDPSPLARRLLDTIKANPSSWLTTVRASAA